MDNDLLSEAEAIRGNADLISLPKPQLNIPPVEPQRDAVYEQFIAQKDLPQRDLQGEYNALRDATVGVLLDTDVETRAVEWQQRDLQPLVDIERETAVARQAMIDAQLKDKANLVENIQANFAVNNSFGSWLTSMEVPVMPRQPGYNPLDDDIDNYWPIVDQISNNVHPAQTQAMKMNYDFEVQQRKILAKSSLPVDIIGSIAGGFSDPTNLLLLMGPPGAVARSGMAAKFAYGVGAATTANAINEVILHGMQDTRTFDESALNVLTGVLLDGTIGGAIVARKAISKVDYDAAHIAIKDYFSRGGVVDLRDGLDSVGAMRAKSADPFGPVRFDVKKNPVRWALGEAALKMAQATTLGKGMFASDDLTRRTTAELAETNWRMTAIKTDYRMAAAAKIEVDNIQKKLKLENGLTSEDFDTELDWAKRRGDTHTNPDIQRAAQIIRGVRQPLWELGAELRIPGFFKEVNGKAVPLDVATAISYETRVYNKNKIDADTGGFENALKLGIEDARVKNNEKVNAEIDQVLSENMDKVDYAISVTSAAPEKKAALQASIVSKDKKARKLREEIGRLKEARHESDVVLEMRGRIDQLVVEKNYIDSKINEIDGKLMERAQQMMERADTQKEVDRLAASVKRMERDKKTFEKLSGNLNKKIENKSLVLAEKERRIPADPKGTRDQKIAEAKSKIDELDAAVKLHEKEIETITRRVAEEKEILAKHKSQMDELNARLIDTYSENDLNVYAHSFYQSVMNLKDGDFHFKADGRPDILKKRQPIADSFLEPYLEKNWSKILDHQIKTLSPRVRLAEKFGDSEMEARLVEVTNGYNDKIMQLREFGKIDEAKKLEAERESQVNNLIFMRDALLGRAFTQKGNETISSIGRAAMNFNVSRMLNGMALASIPELMKIPAKYGVMPTVKASIKALKNWRIKDLPKDDAMRMASAISRAQGVRMAQANDVYDLTPTTKLEHGTRWLANATGYLSGQQGMDSISRSIVGALSQDAFVRMVRDADIEGLMRAGFTREHLEVINREMPKHAKDEDGLWVPHVENWDLTLDGAENYRPLSLKAVFDGGIVKDSDTVIVNPGVGDLPRFQFLSSTMGRIVLQFKTYLIASTNRTLVPLTQGTNTEIVKTLTYMSAAALASYTLYERSRGKEIDWGNTELLVNEVLSRGGYTGYASILVQLYRQAAGQQVASSYRSRDGISAWLGPTYGTINELGRSVNLQRDEETGEFLTDTDARIHAFRKLLPFQNHPIIRRAIDHAEGATAKAAGGEGRFAEPK
jgi:hypothetical protein